MGTQLLSLNITSGVIFAEHSMIMKKSLNKDDIFDISTLRKIFAILSISLTVVDKCGCAHKLLRINV